MLEEQDQGHQILIPNSWFANSWTAKNTKTVRRASQNCWKSKPELLDWRHQCPKVYSFHLTMQSRSRSRCFCVSHSFHPWFPSSASPWPRWIDSPAGSWLTAFITVWFTLKSALAVGAPNWTPHTQASSSLMSQSSCKPKSWFMKYASNSLNFHPWRLWKTVLKRGC